MPAWCAVVLATCLAGCGTDFAELAAQTGNSAVFTVLDVFLTDAANSMLDQTRPAPDHGGEDRAGGDGDGAGDEGDGGDDVGADQVSAGEAAYTAQNCGACHGQDAEGDIGPALAGLDELDALEERFGGGADHNGASLTDQEIADVAAWLLGDDADGGLAGDPAAGEELFTSSVCTACHCPDASGGCSLDAPPLAGTGLVTLDDILRGDASHPGGKFDLTDQEIADLAAWLASI